MEQSKTMGMLSLIFACVSWLFSLISIIPFVGTLFALAGIVTGAIGVDKKQGAMALIGLCLSIAAAA